MGAASLWNEEACRMCGAQLPAGKVGRPSQYCSAACRQRAYRVRRAGVTKTVDDTSSSRARSTGSSPVPEAVRQRQVPHLTDAQLLAWRGMLEVESRLLPLLDEDLQQRTGLTISEFDVLYQLWIAPEQRRRMKHLAKAVLVTPSGITRMVARLEERGLVRRTSHAGRQAVDAALTPEGERRLQQAMDVHFRGVRRLFIDNLSATDIERLVALWRRLRRGLPRALER